MFYGTDRKKYHAGKNVDGGDNLTAKLGTGLGVKVAVQ